eukprot:scaffold297496_cov18-Tisochrysis_lutea.AAC.1
MANNCASELTACCCAGARLGGGCAGVGATGAGGGAGSAVGGGFPEEGLAFGGGDGSRETCDSTGWGEGPTASVLLEGDRLLAGVPFPEGWGPAAAVGGAAVRASAFMGNAFGSIPSRCWGACSMCCCVGCSNSGRACRGGVGMPGRSSMWDAPAPAAPTH